MNPQIEFHEPLALPGPQALAAMTEVMRDVQLHQPRYDRIADALGLSVAIAANAKPYRYECDVEIAARAVPRFFPRFVGTVSISPLQESGSELWLQGSYKAPFGSIGALVDATLLRGVARKSLEEFIAWLASEIRMRNASASQR